MKYEIETKCGVFLDLEIYNRMVRADNAVSALTKDHMSVHLVHMSEVIVLTVKSNTLLSALAKCHKALFKVPFLSDEMLMSSEGVYLDGAHSLYDHGIKSGARLFGVPQ